MAWLVKNRTVKKRENRAHTSHSFLFFLSRLAAMKTHPNPPLANPHHRHLGIFRIPSFVSSCHTAVFVSHYIARSVPLSNTVVEEDVGEHNSLQIKMYN
jgi:hypothetical protein